MDFPDIDSLLDACEEVAREKKVPLELMLRCYLKHYFVGSKAVENTLKHKVLSGLTKEEWWELQQGRF